jgi:CHAD domain-containing protein
MTDLGASEAGARPTDTPLAEYVKSRVGALIGDVIRESARAEHDTSADGIHDLRVAIRRLSESLRVFERLFPPGAANAVRRDLRAAMKQAADARNHDIAGELLRKAELFAHPEIAEGRERAAGKLARVLHRWNSGSVFQAWRERLDA